MGFSKKTQGEASVETEGKKWVIAGISVRSLKPINTTKPRGKENDDDEEEESSTTPTARESRIPEKLAPPPAPRKRRPSRCHNSFNGVREFFNPPDLETVFKCKVEKAI